MQKYLDNEATSSALHATMKPARGGKCLVTMSTYEDRKEALENTTILDAAGTCRSKAVSINTVQQAKQQNNSLDSRETKPDTFSHIPKPPPLQTTYNTSSASNASKSFAVSDQHSGHHLSNSSQIGNDIYSRPNKSAGEGNNSNSQISRQTLRLGSVTIGEYQRIGNQTLKREPERFDFIATQKKGRDSGETTPTNEALQSELQNTLTRANLRKSNGNTYTEHQRNCPLHQQQQLQQRQIVDYGKNGYSVEEITKKLQKSTVNDNKSADHLARTNNCSTSSTGSVTAMGILKNGNRNGTNSSSSKSTEKSIKFG